MDFLRRWLPILVWLPRYRRADLPGDLSAGLTTAVLLIPQAMAYAVLAGLPAIVGLYAAIAPPLVYAVFGTSRKLAVGPVALDSLLVAAALGALPLTTTVSQVIAAAALAIMVGVVQVGMGSLRLGFVVNFLSRPVLSGFTSAAALVIAASQLGPLLGVKVAPSMTVQSLAQEMWAARATVHWPTFAVGAVSIALLLVLRRWRGKALAVVGLGIAASAVFGFDQFGIGILGVVPSGLPTPMVPWIDQATFVALVPAALTIALIALMEALSSGFAVAEIDERPDADHELVALGLSNIATGFLRGYPVTGGLSRTAVNAQAGARSSLAGVVTSATVIITLLVLTPALHSLPRASLAAIIIVAVLALVDVAMPKTLWRLRRRELMVWAITFVATMTLGLTTGVIVGVVSSLGLFILRTTRPHTAILGRLPDTQVYRNVRRFPEAMPVPGLLLLRPDAPLYFANAAYMQDLLMRSIESASEPVRAVVFDAGGIHHVDTTALERLCELHQLLGRRGIELYFAEVKGPVRDILATAGFTDTLGRDHFFFTVHEAVNAALGRIKTLPSQSDGGSD